MEINNRTAQQNPFAISEAFGSGRANPSSTGSPVLADERDSHLSPALATQVPSSNVDYIQQQLEKIMIDDPPFFPAGVPQRIDQIKGVNGIQEQIEKSSTTDSVKKIIEGQKPKDSAPDTKITEASQGLTLFKNSLVKDTPAAPATGKTGAVINIKI